jgi:hypothetical protein
VNTRIHANRFIKMMTRSFGVNTSSYLRRKFSNVNCAVDTPSERRVTCPAVTSSDTS